MSSLSVALVAVALLSTLVLPAAPARASEAGTFEPTDCGFVLPAGQVEGESVECGYLHVPENRLDPASRTIRLALAIFHPPDGPRHQDAVVYLEGGPGGSPLKLVGTLRDFDALFAPVVEAGRDLVLLDQRGIGLSEPALECPEFSDLYVDLLDKELEGAPGRLEESEIRALKAESLLECASGLAAGADLSGYNSAQNAADLEDLRVALGYDELDLWGTSYGTWVALDAMRDHPAGIRSVILDAPAPPDAELYADAPASFQRALDEVFDSCAAEAPCAEAYPDLPGVFSGTVASLAASPVEVEILDSMRGERIPFLVDGDAFLELVFRALYQAPMRQALPMIIHDARDGIFDTILTIAQLDVLRQGFRSWGMYYSVLCHDEVPFTSLADFEAARAEHPDLAGMYEHFEIGPLPFEICERWGAGTADAIEIEPVRSDIPTLITTGQYDPIVPPAWGQSISTWLPNSTFLLFPGLAHGVGGSACATDIMLAFLDDPTGQVESACIDEMPVAPFDLPASAAMATELEPFQSSEAGLEGLRPAGWAELGPGTFARASTGTDPVSLVMAALPLTAEEALTLLVDRLGLESVPDRDAARSTERAAWDLYSTSAQGVGIDFAVAGIDDAALIVVLTSTGGDRDALLEQVYLPAIDALRPADDTAGP